MPVDLHWKDLLDDKAFSLLPVFLICWLTGAFLRHSLQREPPFCINAWEEFQTLLSGKQRRECMRDRLESGVYRTEWKLGCHTGLDSARVSLFWSKIIEELRGWMYDLYDYFSLGLFCFTQLAFLLILSFLNLFLLLRASIWERVLEGVWDWVVFKWGTVRFFYEILDVMQVGYFLYWVWLVEIIWFVS